MTDNCPTCCHGPIEPAATRTNGPNRADRYRCPACGETWITRRYTAAYDDPQRHPDTETAA